MNNSRSINLHGCTVPEAISQFTDFYNDCVRSGYHGYIDVIHGYGSTGQGGAIRTALQQYLESYSSHLEMCVFGDAIGNPGIGIFT
jgi:DNA-nicking Smr family endonuclease